MQRKVIPVLPVQLGDRGAGMDADEFNSVKKIKCQCGVILSRYRVKRGFLKCVICVNKGKGEAYLC